MPKLKQAAKRLRQSLKRRARNRRRVQRYKEVEKNIRQLASAGKKKEAQKLLPKLYKLIDKAASHGPLHPNKASRKKAQIAKLLAGIK